jgi:hypothetical protein
VGLRGESCQNKQHVTQARRHKRKSKASSTQAGEFVREEIHHIRQGRHGARSTKQAIAIGLSKARRAGVRLPPPRRASPRVKHQAQRDYAKGQTTRRKHRSTTRSKAPEELCAGKGTRRRLAPRSPARQKARPPGAQGQSDPPLPKKPRERVNGGVFLVQPLRLSAFKLSQSLWLRSFRFPGTVGATTP